MAEPESGAAAVVEAFVSAFSRVDLEQMAALLDPDLSFTITNPDAGATRLQGRDAYMAAVGTVDYASAELDIAITQLLPLTTSRVLVMVEVKAARKGRTLHNFAAFLIEVRDGLIREMFMVDGKPAESDAFWRA